LLRFPACSESVQDVHKIELFQEDFHKKLTIGFAVRPLADGRSRLR
jgi:hypothetical protein